MVEFAQWREEQSVMHGRALNVTENYRRRFLRVPRRRVRRTVGSLRARLRRSRPWGSRCSRRGVRAGCSG
ncbi:hypothetical protein QJS66_02495 [Kocuria rhizophila]|nr:hypothetical protein QJS66_02495 [Kocuria rhizophila]